MRKRIASFIAICLLLFVSFISNIATPASCHEPEYMGLSFDFENKHLRCLIVHEVTSEDYEDHYISNIKVKRGVVLLADVHYSVGVHYNITEMGYGFRVDAFHKDKLDVTAYCSFGGEISASITLWDPASPTPTADSFSLVSTLCTLVLLSLGPILHRKKFKIKI